MSVWKSLRKRQSHREVGPQSQRSPEHRDREDGRAAEDSEGAMLMTTLELVTGPPPVALGLFLTALDRER